MRTADDVYTEKVTEIVKNVTRLTQNNSVQWALASRNPDVFQGNFQGLLLGFRSNPYLVLTISSTGINPGDCADELDELQRAIYLQLEPWRGSPRSEPDDFDKILEKLSKA